MGGSRGGTGGLDPPPRPLKYHKNIGFHSNIDADPLKITKLPSQHSMVGHPGQVVQSVTCLATDASLTADLGVVSSIPAQSHTFVEIDHGIISTVIFLPSAESFKKGCCQLQAKVCAQSTGQLLCLFKLAQEKVWLGELTVPP